MVPFPVFHFHACRVFRHFEVCRFLRSAIFSALTHVCLFICRVRLDGSHSHGCHLSMHSWSYLSSSQIASPASCEVLMRHSRRCKAGKYQLIERRCPGRSRGGTGGATGRRIAHQTRRRLYAENVEIVDKNHNQSDPISGHVRDIRLRSSRPAKNNRPPTGLSPSLLLLQSLMEATASAAARCSSTSLPRC